MRYEFVVAEDQQQWSVRRGVTSKLSFASREAALSAAESMARAAADQGATGVILLAQPNGMAEHQTFQPDETSSFAARTEIPPWRRPGRQA